MGSSRSNARRGRARNVRLAAIVLSAAACAGTPAEARQPAPSTPPAGAPDRAYVYEVAPEQIAQARDTGVVRVSGRGEVMVAPDRARASFAVETRASSAGEASAANAEAMNAVMAALRGTGLPGLDIETFGYTLRPEYRMGTDRSRVIDGYTALNNVVVTLDDVTAVGRVIDAAIGAGANRVAGLVFEASDTEGARLDALRLAVERATAEARAIATALGRELGAPLDVQGGAEVPGPQVRAMMQTMEAQAAPTPIEAGDQAVRATVSITFALGPPRSGR